VAYKGKPKQIHSFIQTKSFIMRLPAAYLAAADDTSRVRAIITCNDEEGSIAEGLWVACKPAEVQVWGEVLPSA
jgi:hypothetical protein